MKLSGKIAVKHVGNEHQAEEYKKEIFTPVIAGRQ
jgi:hypothetical protein